MLKTPCPYWAVYSTTGSNNCLGKSKSKLWASYIQFPFLCISPSDWIFCMLCVEKKPLRCNPDTRACSHAKQTAVRGLTGGRWHMIIVLYRKTLRNSLVNCREIHNTIFIDLSPNFLDGMSQKSTKIGTLDKTKKILLGLREYCQIIPSTLTQWLSQDISFPYDK